MQRNVGIKTNKRNSNKGFRFGGQLANEEVKGKRIKF